MSQVEFTRNFERRRIVDPKACKPGSFRTHDVGRPGFSKRIACISRRTGRWITQSLLISLAEPAEAKARLRQSATRLIARHKTPRRA